MYLGQEPSNARRCLRVPQRVSETPPAVEWIDFPGLARAVSQLI